MKMDTDIVLNITLLKSASTGAFFTFSKNKVPVYILKVISDDDSSDEFSDRLLHLQMQRRSLP